ncbi:MAG: 5-formyltetrahydrofolate cyclo-ligase [Betaproteobacteria bacterium]|nr:5-formyltetrahydrofolate cyclo-ligase [Betaproteobacteria bacterium]
MPATDRPAARLALRRRVSRLPARWLAPASARLFDRVRALLADRTPAGRRIAAYWPLPGEPDPRLALRGWHAAGWQILLPRVVMRDAPLAFHRWAPDQPLEAGPFGTRQPAPDSPQDRPDLLIIPCLGFDARGWRLGHGGGFYDRSLAALAADGRAPLTIGVAWSSQEVDGFAPGPHDRGLDWIVTERRTLRAWAPG